MPKYGSKKCDVYYATYIGKHKKISISGIGEIKIGKEFKIENKEIFYAMKLDPNFKTRIGYVYK